MTNNIKVDIDFFVADPNENIDYNSLKLGTTIDRFNNISTPSELGELANDELPFILNSSKLNSVDRLLNKYSGIIAIRKDNATNFQLTLSVNNCDSFLIKFDSNKSRPKTMNYTYRVYETDHYEVKYKELDIETNSAAVVFDEVYSGSIGLTFYNKDNSELIEVLYIEAMYISYNQVISNNLISSITLGNEIASENSKPTFGIISGYGTLVLTDKDNVLMEKLTSNVLTSKSNINFYYNDKKISSFVSKKTTTDTEFKKITIELTNDFTWLDRIKFRIDYVYDNANLPFNNAYDMLVSFFDKIKTANNKVKYLIIEDDLKARLNNITINQPYHPYDTMTNILKDYCDFAFVCIKFNDDSLEVYDYV